MSCRACGGTGGRIVTDVDGTEMRACSACGGQGSVSTPETPRTCADVTFDMRDAGYGEPAYDGCVGDLLWDPKGDEGHVLVAEVACGAEHEGRRLDCGCGGWGIQPCPSTTLVCACGQDGSWRDHHYCLLARMTA